MSRIMRMVAFVEVITIPIFPRHPLATTGELNALTSRLIVYSSGFGFWRLAQDGLIKESAFSNGVSFSEVNQYVWLAKS
jgi:hypothetical protein